MITGTSYFFNSNRDRMLSLSATADRLQTQMATGKKLLAPSQDPAGWQRLQSLIQAKGNAQAYNGTIAVAQGILQQTDGTLATVQSQLQRANELAIKANNGVMSMGDRSAIAEELDQIVADLTGLSNAKDTRGLPLFDEDAAPMPVGEGVNVIVNADRNQVFGTILSALSAYAGQLRTGTPQSVTTDSAAAITAITGAISNVANQQGSIGARAARVDLIAASAGDAAQMIDAQRASIEDADPTSTIADLQKTMTILQATQASFTRLSQLSLFDYLR